MEHVKEQEQKNANSFKMDNDKLNRVLIKITDHYIKQTVRNIKMAIASFLIIFTLVLAIISQTNFMLFIHNTYESIY